MKRRQRCTLAPVVVEQAVSRVVEIKLALPRSTLRALRTEARRINMAPSALMIDILRDHAASSSGAVTLETAS